MELFKKFSVGLTLDTGCTEFTNFLDKYHKYISNFYFSPPMGDKFHSRSNVVQQMRDPKKVKLFWDLLKIIKDHEIKLELVLNNGNLTEKEVFACKELFESKGITLDMVGFTDDIYEYVKKAFPNLEYVHSFNNFLNTRQEYEDVCNKYHEFVVGRGCLRDTELFKYIKESKGAKVVLLLNNGCSHICGGCKRLVNCHGAYYKAREKYLPEQLYALQSVFPYELHEKGFLDTTYVDLYKINSRNANVPYIEACLDSYINNKDREYVEKDIESYALFGRLAWHVEYYGGFSYDRIKAYKRAIYNGEKIERPLQREPLTVGIDLCDDYIFNSSEKELELDKILEHISTYSEGADYRVKELYFGSSCDILLRKINYDRANELLEKLKEKYKLHFVLPPLKEKLDNKLLELLKKHISVVVVNDLNTICTLKELNINIALGPNLVKSTSQVNSFETGNDLSFGSDLFDKETRELVKKYNARFVLCQMNENGLCIGVNEDIDIKAYFQIETLKTDICPYKDQSCKGNCTREFYKEKGIKYENRCGTIIRMVELTPSIRKTITERRFTLIYRA